ncbi:MAG: FkbM family methyltransferase [Oligoflexia bacterium]|nr:FkbM family methyltransferase [Oligoflexia bacterium]
MKTSHKIIFAKIAYKFVSLTRSLLGKTNITRVKRMGINWKLDISEGIDFSIYLLGGFEIKTLRMYKNIIREGHTVLDIGANIGAHTFPLAHLVGRTGKVIAFEPTNFAFQKLQENIKLNPKLSNRIISRQSILCHKNDAPIAPSVFSSWPLDSNGKDLHPKHKGYLKSTQGTKAETLDEAVNCLRLSKIDFIKIDVDGNEQKVLEGGRKTLEKYRPTIMMEFAPYLTSEQEFRYIVSLFVKLNYTFYNASNMKKVTSDWSILKTMIHDGASINVLLKNSHS